MTDTDAESSMIVNRVTMEDNIFDKQPRRDYRTASSSHVHFSPLQPPKESKLSQIAGTIVLVSVIVQVIFGLFANSLALISDACRQFSDHLEQHKYDHSSSPGHRIREVLAMVVPCVITAILCVVFLVNASTRAVNPVFEVNILFLVLDWKAYTSYSVVQFAQNHRSQCLHGLINHGLAITIVIVSILLMISDDFRIYDSVGTYIITGLIVTNIAAASLQCYKEYCDLEFARGDYEEL